jgi:3-methyladenine DNA glycosylase AlkD
MILGSLVADPKAATRALLEQWVREAYCPALTDQVAAYAGKTALAQELMAEWTRSDDEWVGCVGWGIMAHLALDKAPWPDALFEDKLETIEREIHARPNFTRYQMNNTLIAIGIRNDHLEALAIAAARRIGKVVVDHGQTCCQTPDAESYILRAKARRQR